MRMRRNSMQQYCDPPHIWDNVISNFGRRVTTTEAETNKVYFDAQCDSTGSSIDLMHVTEAVTKTEKTELPLPRVPRRSTKHAKTCHLKLASPPAPPLYRDHHHHHHLNLHHHHQKVPRYVTDSDRATTPSQPRQLASWRFSPEKLDKYDGKAARDAFDEYSKRMMLKKQKEGKRRVTEECVVEEERITMRKMEKKGGVEVRSRRNDEIMIEAMKKKEEEVIVVKKHHDHHIPSFYGTIEAEKCAGKAAEHIQKACENLKRLQFINETLYPQSNEHLEKLENIGGDIKDFNRQMQLHKADVPKNVILNGNQVAHFVIDDIG